MKQGFNERLLAIDPSLTCSGWALFHLKEEKLLGIGSLKSLSPKFPLSSRLENLQQRIVELIKKLGLHEGDYLVCEAPTTMKDPKAAFKVEQVRSIFEVTARSAGLTVPGRINPRTVHWELMGMRGHQLSRNEVKYAAVRVAQTLFKDSLEMLGFEPSETNLTRHQDIVDALLLGNLAVGRVLQAKQGGLSVDIVFSQGEKRVRWRSISNS